MNPSITRRPADNPARRQEAERHVRTAKDLLLSGKTEVNIKRCWELVNEALSIDPCAPGGNALLVAATALRATDHRFLLPSGDPEPYAVLGLIPTVSTARNPAVIESYYRQASDLLDHCHPRDPCYPVFTEAARLVADAWAFLSDPDCKAALDSAYDALALAAERQPKRSRSVDDDDGNSKESAIDLDKLDRSSKVQEETNASRIKVLKLEQKLSSERLETTTLAHLTAQETKEANKLLLEAKKVEKESKMMDAYNKLISQDTSSMSDEEKAERVVALKCFRKAFFPETV